MRIGPALTVFVLTLAAIPACSSQQESPLIGKSKSAEAGAKKGATKDDDDADSQKPSTKPKDTSDQDADENKEGTEKDLPKPDDDDSGKMDENAYPAPFSLTNTKDKCFTVDGKYHLLQRDCNAAEFEGVQTFKMNKIANGKINIKVVTRFTYNPVEYCLGIEKGKADDNAAALVAPCSASAADQEWKSVKVSEGVYRLASALNETKCLNTSSDSLYIKDCKDVETQNLSIFDSKQRRDLAKEADNAPSTIKEDWFEHEELLYKMYEDASIVIYGDAEWKAKPRESIHEYTKKAWSYFTKRFGNMGGYRLYAVYHGSSKYSGGHPDGFFNSRHHYRNFLDVGASGWPSTGLNAGVLNVLVHEMAHIVERQMFGVRGTPGVVLWGDNKIYEMILYDVYSEMKETGHRDSSAANWKTQNVSTNADGAAKPGTRVDGTGAYWFRDWSLPLIQEFGSDKSIVNFFALTSKYFPHDLLNYKRSFNWGEYCHFMSGAVGKNLKERMTIAFGWDAKREAEFEQAKKDFPDIKY